MTTTDFLDPRDRRYIELMKTVLLGNHNPETGARMHYLLECLGQSPSPIAATRQFDGAYLAAIGDHEPETWQGILDDNSRYGWERILGFPQSMGSQDPLLDVERAILTKHQEGIAGDFLETGVWRGGVGIFAKALYGVLDDQIRTV